MEIRFYIEEHTWLRRGLNPTALGCCGDNHPENPALSEKSSVTELPAGERRIPAAAWQWLFSWIQSFSAQNIFGLPWVFWGSCSYWLISRRIWLCMKMQEPSTTFSFVKHFWGVCSVREGVLPAGLMCPLCGFRSDTGKLWQIPRTSGGERRSLWKMPNSLVSRRAVFAALACLPEHRKCWSAAFLSPVLPSLIYFKACCDVWPELLISGLNHYFFSVSSCVLSSRVYPQNHIIVIIFYFF